MGVRVKLSETNLTRYLATADEWVSTVLRGIWRAFLSGAAMYGATMYGYSNLEDLQSYVADWARQPMNRHRSDAGTAGEGNHDQLTERVRKLELAAVTTAQNNCTSPIRIPNLAQATLCSIPPQEPRREYFTMITASLEADDSRLKIASRTAPLGRSGQSVNGSFAAARRIFLVLSVWHDRIATRRVFAELDDHLLHDLGFIRADVERTSRKPFWMA